MKEVVKVLRGSDEKFIDLIKDNRVSGRNKTPILFFIDKELSPEEVSTVANILNIVIESFEEGGSEVHYETCGK